MEKNLKDYGFEYTNVDKVLFPADGYTKKDLIDYYISVSESMLPHMRGRPVSMNRFPDGIKGDGFYQKQIPAYFPKWINRASVEKKEGVTEELVVCDDAATLAYLANQACITPHTWLSRSDALNNPDKMVYDLDPPDNGFELAKEAAHMLKEILEGFGLPVYVMTTGSKGLHVTIPLDRELDYDQVRGFAGNIAKELERKDPKRLTTDIRKDKRGGRLFIDVNRNAYAQTAVPPYAVRAKDGAPVAAPLEWKELDDPDRGPQKYNIMNMPERLRKNKDPWSGMWKKTLSLKKALGGD